MVVSTRLASMQLARIPRSHSSSLESAVAEVVMLSRSLRASKMNHSVACPSRTSTSSSSMTPNTVPKLSIKPFTATRSILLVVALYSALKTVSSSHRTKSASCSPAAGVSAAAVESSENDLQTSEDSSLSTCSVCRAKEARRAVGKGTSTVLDADQSLRCV